MPPSVPLCVPPLKLLNIIKLDNMNYPLISVVFDEKKLATKTKEGLVQIRVYYNHKRKFISTNVKVFADQWSDKTFVKGRSDAMELNNQINEMLGDVRECVNRCIKQHGVFSFERLGDMLGASKVSSGSFLDYFRSRIYEKNVRPSTLKQYETLYNILKEFGEIQTFQDVNESNLIRFEEWQKKKGLRQTTIGTRLGIIKSFVLEAKKIGLFDRNPLDGYSVDRGKARGRRYLTPEELKLITSAELEGSHAVARDWFLFMCYTALSYADALKFDFHRDCFIKDGKHVFRDTRQKTEEEYFIVLIPPALEILKKYNYRLPKYSNGCMNTLLKGVALIAGIKKEITCHMARHTAACLALNNDVRIEVVSKMLGHSNINTTQIYAKMLTKEIEKAYDKIADVWGEIET